MTPSASRDVDDAPAKRAAQQAAIPVVHYRTAKVDGVDVFYREAGPADAPVVLLLHGFPTSSHMFRNLIPALADRYHVIAPDYPGFGESGAPDHKAFAYTFAHYADLSKAFCRSLASAAMRSTSWTTARRSATGWRSSIPIA
jgi:alpha-beta hydrolase superfamily lysophospholipase